MSEGPRKAMVEPQAPVSASTGRRVVRIIEQCIFAIRWMLIVPYIGLAAVAALYIAHLVHEVFEMAMNYYHHVTDQNILLLFGLEVLDMVLINQLFVMTIQGGYFIFIHPLNEAGFPLPQWLKHGLSTSDQKIKMGMSIMNIMLVQMLDMYIKMVTSKAPNAREIFAQDLWWREQMLGCAIITTIAFCVINLLMHPEMFRKKPANEDH